MPIAAVEEHSRWLLRQGASNGSATVARGSWSMPIAEVRGTEQEQRECECLGSNRRLARMARRERNELAWLG